MIGLTIIFIILLYIYIAYKTLRYVTNKTEKKRYWILTLLFFILLPIWDVIIGKFYFNHLCETQGGLKVYKSVQAEGVLQNGMIINHDGGIFVSDRERFRKLGFKYLEGLRRDQIEHLNLEDRDQTIQTLKEPRSRYIFIYNEKSKPVQWLPIVKNRALIKDRHTEEILGEDIGFSYFGAWIGILADRLVSGVSKPKSECLNNSTKLLKQTLRLKGENNGK